MKRLVALAALVACALMASRADQPLATIDSAAIKRSLSQVLRHAETRAIPLATLRRQLERTTCALRLPRSRMAAMSPAQVYRVRRDSVFIMAVLYPCGKCTNLHVSVAAGFCIASNGVMVTNYHVVDNTNGILICAVSLEGVAYPVREVLAADKDADIAIVRVEADNLAPVPLAARADVGDIVGVISHPGDRFYLFTSGMVSGYYLSYDHQRHTVPIMAITADFAQGSSGGPVLDMCGEIVGMVASTQTLAADTEKNQEHTQMVLKNCVPVDSIRALISAP